MQNRKRVNNPQKCHKLSGLHHRKLMILFQPQHNQVKVMSMSYLKILIENPKHFKGKILNISFVMGYFDVENFNNEYGILFVTKENSFKVLHFFQNMENRQLRGNFDQKLNNKNTI